MKNFWGSFLGAITGLVVASVVGTFIFLIGMAIIFGAAFKGSGSGDKWTLKDNTVLHLTLNQPIGDRTDYNPFSSGFDIDDMDPKLGLDDITTAIRYAKTDDKIKGIYLELSGVPSGIATLEEIREVLVDFKESGKFIYAYSSGYSQKAYYMASVSTEIFLNPVAGGVDFKGLGAELMFFKNTLDKLGVDPVIIRPTGNRFKSAVEPFFLDKASESNRLQLEVLLGSMWNKIVTDISDQTEISTDELNRIASEYAAYSAITAEDLGMVDGLKYEDEMLDMLKESSGIEEDKDLRLVRLGKYFKKIRKKTIKESDNKIAVVYAAGSIVGGEGDNDQIGGERFVKTIRKAREDEDVKAVVLRVNSPGGDAIASELIWREVFLTEKVKPVVVSMGNYAASGGYYISCAADTIVADETTLTGSIGVFSVMFNMQKMLNNKLGITTDTVKTHPMADFPNVFMPFGDKQKEILQRQVDDIYTLFLQRVADGRNLTVADVDSIAQGRVWTGVMAKELGLVDVIGGLDKAITIAAEMAELESYELIQMPQDDSPLGKFFRNLSSESSDAFITEQLGEETFKYLQHVKTARTMKGIQARLPFAIDIF